MEEATTPTWLSNPLYFFGLKDYRSPTPSPTTIEQKQDVDGMPSQSHRANPATVPDMRSSAGGHGTHKKPLQAKNTKSAMKIPDLQVDKRVTPMTPAMNENIQAITNDTRALFPDDKDPLASKGRQSLSPKEVMTSLCNGAVCVSKSSAQQGNMSPTALERKFLRQSIASAEVYKTSLPLEMSKSLLQHMEELNNMRVEAFQRYRDTADPTEAQRWGRQYQEISEQILEAQVELCDASKAVCDFVREHSGKQSLEDPKCPPKKMPKMGNMAAGPVKHLILQKQSDGNDSVEESTNSSTASLSTCADTTIDDDADEFLSGLSPTALEHRLLRQSQGNEDEMAEHLGSGIGHNTALRNGPNLGLEFTCSLSPTAMERKILRNSMSWTDVYQSVKPPRMSAEFLDGVDELNKKVAKDSALRSIEHLSQKRKQVFNKYRESLGTDGDAIDQSLKEYREISSEIAGQRRSLLEATTAMKHGHSRNSPRVATEQEMSVVKEESVSDVRASDFAKLDMPAKTKSGTPSRGRPSGLEAALKTPIKTPIRTPAPRPPSGMKANSGVKQKQLFATPKAIATPTCLPSVEKMAVATCTTPLPSEKEKVAVAVSPVCVPSVEKETRTVAVSPAFLPSMEKETRSVAVSPAFLPSMEKETLTVAVSPASLPSEEKTGVATCTNPSCLPLEKVAASAEFKVQAPLQVSEQQIDTSQFWKDEMSNTIPNASSTFLADTNTSPFLADTLVAMEKEFGVIEQSLHPLQVLQQSLHPTTQKAMKDLPILSEATLKSPPAAISNKQCQTFATPKLVETPFKMPFLEEKETAPAKPEFNMPMLIETPFKMPLLEREDPAPAQAIIGMQDDDIKEDEKANDITETANQQVQIALMEDIPPKETSAQLEDSPGPEEQTQENENREKDRLSIVLKRIPGSAKDRLSVDERIELPRTKLGELADGPVNLERQSMHEVAHASTFNFFDMLSFFKRYVAWHRNRILMFVSDKFGDAQATWIQRERRSRFSDGKGGTPQEILGS